MARSIRLALVDMDGTLLGKDQVRVSPRNLAALNAMHAKGIEIVPCTGRVVDMNPPQLLTLPYIRYFVSCHGARVYDRWEGRTLYEDIIPAEAAPRVLRAIEGQGLYAEIAADHTIYIEQALAEALDAAPVPAHHVWYMRDQRRYTAVPSLSRHFEEHRLGIEKVNIYGIPGSAQQSVFDAVTATGAIRHTRGAAARDLEFSSKTLDKGKALAALMRELRIPYEETFAIGDSSTDYDAIRMAGIGVAMGNAPAPIQAVADAVTAPNTEDGFAQAVERFLL